MLDWEPPDTEEPSELERGGVSAPDEAEVLQVLERERPAGEGLLNIEFSRTVSAINENCTRLEPVRYSHEANSSSPCAMRALSSRL